MPTEADTRQEVTLEEQIAWQRIKVDACPSPLERAIVASLRKLQSIQQRVAGAERPRPAAWTIPGDDNEDVNGFLPCRISREGEFTKPLYGPDFAAYADRVEAERDALQAMNDASWESLYRKEVAAHAETDTRANSLASQLTALQRKYDAVVEGLREALPYVQARHHHYVAVTADTHTPVSCEQCATEARAAELLRQVEGRE